MLNTTLFLMAMQYFIYTTKQTLKWLQWNVDVIVLREVEHTSIVS